MTGNEFDVIVVGGPIAPGNQPGTDRGAAIRDRRQLGHGPGDGKHNIIADVGRGLSESSVIQGVGPLRFYDPACYWDNEETRKSAVLDAIAISPKAFRLGSVLTVISLVGGGCSHAMRRFS